MEKQNYTNNGFGLSGLLTVLFVGLKLTGNINWSWWWVLSPIWISVVLSIILAIIFYPVFAEMYKD
jgi:uncharacterized protein (DUF983 family)